MAVKILIRRKVPESHAASLVKLLKDLRVATTKQPGYISGETFKRVDRPEEFLVISTWQSSDDWRRWVASDVRKEIQGRVDMLLGFETTYEIWEYA